MPDILYGLNVNEFAHPDDLAAIKSLKKSAAIDKLTSFIEDKTSQSVLRMKTLGSCVRITPESGSRIYKIVRDTCDILQYERVPEIYIYRNFGMDVEPHGVDNPVIVIPDFVVNQFDDELLRFTIGRAITRLKSDYLKFYIAATGIVMLADNVNIISDAVKIPLANWMRKSELTADRGGLLACQNFRSAMKFLMCKAGMPISQLDNVDQNDYIETCMSDSKLVNAAKKVMTISNCTGWSNDRIMELYVWYAKGAYDDILDEHVE